VILSFDSKHGPLSYPCDRYTQWQDNVRAIALSLEALRSVDRYGVTRRAEQYCGWQRLPGAGGNGPCTIDEATARLRNILASRGMRPTPFELRHESLAAGYLRHAELATHPDRGGDAAQFKEVERIREFLEKHFGRRLS
jgi:hypothetical protein